MLFFLVSSKVLDDIAKISFYVLILSFDIFTIGARATKPPILFAISSWLFARAENI